MGETKETIGTFLILVRHGAFTYDPNKEFSDPPLTEEGRTQIQKLAEMLRQDIQREGLKLATIYTSSTRRCIESTGIIKEGCLPEIPLQIQIEAAFTLPGVFWQGQCYYPAGMNAKLVEDRERIFKAAKEKAMEILTCHEGEAVVIVSSSPVLRAIEFLAVETIRIGEENASISCSDESVREFEKKAGSFPNDKYLIIHFLDPFTVQLFWSKRIG